MSLLSDIEIPAGQYSWIRLILDENNPAQINLDDGSVHPLTIPSGSQTGIGEYKLRPTLRIIDNRQIGNLSGQVFADLISDNCSRAVYRCEGHFINPDDIGSNNEPIASAIVKLNNSGDYLFEIGFLDAGNYTASFTCEADLDPSSNDDIEFIASENITITTD